MPFVKLNNRGGARQGLRCLRDSWVRQAELRQGLRYAFESHGLLDSVPHSVPRVHQGACTLEGV